MAQLAEQLICNQQVIGSSPIIGLCMRLNDCERKRSLSFVRFLFIFFWEFPGNVAGWSSLEARRAHNPEVVGSNPTPAIFVTYFNFTYGRIPEWPKGTDCKSAAHCFGGSNPPPPSYNLILFGGSSSMLPQYTCPDSSVGRAED